ncbi:MAG: ABC transporter substrate-binding protein [Alphaproteobacteria bacterium]|nr:ABC transporter substrate-binding protein [Alphaproteobacteria bacterium]MCW5740640.1 ABC transporter substrate-binding protein [Alphaproteobacteria bacterium]
MIPRRVFALGTGAGLLALSRAGLAQPAGRMPIIGVLRPHTLDRTFSAFIDRLAELGHEDGRSARIVIKSADRQLDRLPALAAELVQMKPAVILTINTPPTRAAINATKEIPIVMTLVGDPIGQGFVKNLSRPGGNVTGRANLGTDLTAKRLQLLKEIVAHARRIAVLFNPDDPNTTPQRRQVERAVTQIGVEVRFIAVRSPEGVAAAFAELTHWRADAAWWLAGQETALVPPSIALAAERRLPMMVSQRQQVEAGGLLSYIADAAANYRAAADYVDRILKGARPGDLPVDQPTEIALSINLKTARALGLTLPPSILVRANDLFE